MGVQKEIYVKKNGTDEVLYYSVFLIPFSVKKNGTNYTISSISFHLAYFILYYSYI